MPVKPAIVVGARATKKRKKVALQPEEVGFLWARAEAYRDARSALTGQHHVSPAVHYGLLFLALVAQRKHAIINLPRAGLPDDRPGLPEGWGLAIWPEEIMKGSIEHALPLPPVVLEICRRAMAQADIVRSRQSEEQSEWVFPASATRTRGTLKLVDRHIGDSALHQHLARMRGKRCDQPDDAVDHLVGLPNFSLHMLRHSLTVFVGDKRRGLPAIGASAVLAHKLPSNAGEQVSETTLQFYDIAQRIDDKLIVLEAWSQEILAAYVEAGGTEFASYLPSPDVSAAK